MHTECSPVRTTAGRAFSLAVAEQPFDVQAHRGGAGLVSESTPAAFANAMELGVSTLELDTQITKDGYAVVTAPAFPGDPAYPYVGDYIKDLTLAELRTLDCGSQRLAEFPEQRTVPRARMPLLSEVLGLVKCYRARQVWLNVETKVEAGAPEQTAPREQFVQVVAREIRDAHLLDRVTIHVPYTTPEMVRQTHEADMLVIPWTIDDPATMVSLMDVGVDGVITNYPNRLRALMAERGLKLPVGYRQPPGHDCQAEVQGRAERVAQRWRE